MKRALLQKLVALFVSLLLVFFLKNWKKTNKVATNTPTKFKEDCRSYLAKEKPFDFYYNSQKKEDIVIRSDSGDCSENLSKLFLKDFEHKYVQDKANEWNNKVFYLGNNNFFLHLEQNSTASLIFYNVVDKSSYVIQSFQKAVTVSDVKTNTDNSTVSYTVKAIAVGCEREDCIENMRKYIAYVCSVQGEITYSLEKRVVLSRVQTEEMKKICK